MTLLKSIFINGTIDVESAHTATISGTVTDPSNVTGIEIFDGQSDVGPATLNQDGTWTFDSFFDGISKFTAVETDASGATQTSDALFVESDEPMPGQIASFHALSDQDVASFVYGPRGRTLYTVETSGIGGNSAHDELSGQGGPSIPFFGPPMLSGVDFSETIENFRVLGPHHDTVDLSGTQFQTLADVLQNTTMNGGNATIHVDSHTTLTLDNVNKQQIAASRHDFVFASAPPAS